MSSTQGVDVEIHEARRASSRRVLDVWSQLAERYARPLHEDDIVDLRTETFVKDRGVVRGLRAQYEFGCFADASDEDKDNSSEGAHDVDADDDYDELDAFAPEANISDELEIERQKHDAQQLRIMDSADAEDLRHFLEAEKRIQEDHGHEDEDSVAPSEDGVADSPDELADSPDELTDSPDGLADSPGGLADSPDELDLASSPPLLSEEESDDELAAWDDITESPNFRPAVSSPSKQASLQKQHTPSPQEQHTPSPQKQHTPSPQKQHTPSSQKQHTPSSQKQHTPSPQKQHPPSPQKQHTPLPRQYTPSPRLPLKKPRLGTPPRHVPKSPVDEMVKKRKRVVSSEVEMESDEMTTVEGYEWMEPNSDDRDAQEKFSNVEPRQSAIGPSRLTADDFGERYFLSRNPCLTDMGYSDHEPYSLSGHRRPPLYPTEASSSPPRVQYQAHPQRLQTPSRRNHTDYNEHFQANKPPPPPPLPPGADPNIQMYIAHAMQHLASYLMNATPSNTSWLPPYPPPPWSSAGEQSHDRFATPTRQPYPNLHTPSHSRATLPPDSPEVSSSPMSVTGRAGALVSRSRSHGRRVTFNLEHEEIRRSSSPEQQSPTAKLGAGRAGNMRTMSHASATDDSPEMLTPTRGRRFRRAQTPGPPSRRTSPSPSSSKRSMSAPRR
jgi:hypothetical protein